MSIRQSIIIVFVLSCIVKLEGQQIAISRIEQMPNLPAPYHMRNWKSVATGYDSLIFNTDATGEFLPLSSLYSNTVNYPASPSFRVRSYVGSPGPGGEGINCLPAVVGAELVGIDKRNQNGRDWVSMCKEWFNTLPAENVYLNSPRASSGDDWWYETMPNVFFYQLYDLHPEVAEFKTHSTAVADRWLTAVKSMNGSVTPWRLPSMDHRAWNLSTMTPNDLGVHEPEAAGAIGWILYQAYLKTGDEQYRVGAEWSMEFLNSLSLNPSYELQLVYGVYTAARMNAELGTMYDLQKLFTWCFDVGPLRSWGTTLGKWGEYDCFGLVGEVQQFEPSYAFLMNTFQHVGALAPVARYDDRYARAIGKWILNAANAARLFYPNYLPDAHQDSRAWSSQYDPRSYIGHEALKQTESAKSPFATGDAVKNGWAATNLALYGSSHVGYLAAVVDTTNIPMVLQIDLLKTDVGHAPAYPTFLYFNPHDSAVSVALLVGNEPVDVYDAVFNGMINNSVTNQTVIEIPANSARVVVLAPSGGSVTYVDEKMMINGIVADYRSTQTVVNHAPRIKSVAASKDTVLRKQIVELFCTAEDRDGDSLTIAWQSSYGTVNGSGAQISWTAPDSAGVYTILCTVNDAHGAAKVDTLFVEVVASINHNPVIQRLFAKPRKLDLNSSTTVTCVAADADPDTVYYSWSASEGILSGTGATVAWQSPMTEGNVVISCSVSDGHGAIVKDSITIEVRDFSKFVKGTVLAYYPFNGSANDESGNNRNGTVVNAQLTNDRNGTANSAYSFDGATASIRIPNDNGLNVQSAVSLNFWMTVGAMYNREQYPLSHGNWMNRWKISVANNRIRWTVKTSAGIKDLDSEREIVLDSMYNITAVYNGYDMELYLNDELDAFTSFTGALQTTSLDLTIGQSVPNDNNYNFNGVLDDIRIFDYGLSVAEIQTLSSRISAVNGNELSTVPEYYALSTYPNPFNPVATIRLLLPSDGLVTIKMFDVLGREVAVLFNGFARAGIIETKWNAERHASGMYFCTASVSDRLLTNKLLLLR